MQKIILASGSPRRKEILESFNIKPKIITNDILEKIDLNNTPVQIAMSLAFEKAYSVGLLNTKDIVIGADTIVVYQNKILGKPKDENMALEYLKLLSGNEHSVITGFSIINLESNIKVVDFEETIVKFRNLDDRLIKKYINTGEYKDKAGAYGIQEYGALLVERIEGCYLNVVGLPISKLNLLLGKHFNINIL